MCQAFHTRSPAPQNDIIRGVTVSKDDSADPQTPRKPPLTGDSWAEDQERMCFSGKKNYIYIYVCVCDPTKDFEKLNELQPQILNA